MRRIIGCPRREGEAGYTMVELLLVTTMVSILSTISWPTYSQVLLRAKMSEGVAGCGAIRTAMSLFAAKHDGKYPIIRGANGSDIEILGFRDNELDGKYVDPENYLVVSSRDDYTISVTYERRTYAIDEHGEEIGELSIEH